MNSIKVLHVIDKLSMDGINPSSCAVLLADWYESLDAEQFQSRVCTLRSPDPAGQYLESRGISVDYIGHGKLSPKNIYSICGLIKKHNIDIVHLHGYSAANFGRITAKIRKVPNIVHEHAVLKVQPHQYLADKLLCRATDVGVAVSEYVRDFMIKSRSIPADRIKVIYNGINLDKYGDISTDEKQAKRKELGLPDSTKLVGTITRLREEKGNEYLIRAVPFILEKIPEFVLLIVGDGPLKKQLMDTTDQLGVSESVKFLGFRSDVPELLSSLDVNVIPSLTEGFPLCLVEAMAAGNAIVATEVGGMKEVGRDKDTVFFVPPKDPEAIAESVVNILLNPPVQHALSISAKTASLEFGIAICSARLADEYRELSAIS